MKKVKTVVATGVFEIIHPGHILFLKEAKKLGDRLVVIITRDVNVKKYKRMPHINEEQRRQVVEALKPVDKAILGDEKDPLKPILKIRPDVIALGFDQEIDEEELKKKLLERKLKIKIVRIHKYWDEALHSSSHIIQKIKGEK